MLLVLIWRGEVRTVPALRDWPLLALLGALGVTAFGALYTVGLRWTGAAEGTLIQGMSPLLTLLLAALLVGLLSSLGVLILPQLTLVLTFLVMAVVLMIGTVLLTLLALRLRERTPQR